MLGNSLTYTTIPVTDLERAKDFYVNKLGLEFVGSEMDGIAMLKTSQGSMVFLFQRGQTRADHAVMAFAVDDVEKIVDEMTAAGISFEKYDFGPDMRTNEKGIVDMGKDGKVAWFKDTEGNILRIDPKL